MARVLILTDKGPGGGGIRRVVERHAALLSGAGWEVDLRQYDQGPAPADITHLHLGFTTLTDAMLDQITGPLVLSLHDISPFRHMSALIRQFGLPRPKGLDLLRVGFRARRRQAMWQRLVERAAAIHAPSTFLADLARANGAAKVHTIPHAVDLPETVPPPGQGILCVGLQSVEKGALLAVNAMAELAKRHPDAHLTVLGDGPDLKHAKALASQTGAPVTHRGAVPPAEVAMAMAQSALLLHPSLIPEGLGLVGLEAMALGRPVVGTGRGGVADWLIPGQTGWQADATPEALAHALAEALSDPDQLASYGANGRAMVAERFRDPVVLNGLQTLYAKAMGDGA